ncbi:hypothetical protein C7212DRAFT_305565, partial [Tuber magnatum]
HQNPKPYRTQNFSSAQNQLPPPSSSTPTPPPPPPPPINKSNPYASKPPTRPITPTIPTRVTGAGVRSAFFIQSVAELVMLIASSSGSGSGANVLVGGMDGV